MSDFSSFIYVDCRVEIQCAGCGAVEDASGGSEREAENQLNGVLLSAGWRVLDNKPYCAGCYRASAEARLESEIQERRAEFGI